MKYYIPTTTLNFNNILSTESISPAAFYPVRGFGNKSWETIAENQPIVCIVLYDKLSYFERPKSDQDDHPLLIEVELDDDFKLEEISKEKGIYRCSKTIYLTPINTRFLFFSEQDKRIALSLSTHQLDVKLAGIYCNCLVVLDKHPETTYPSSLPPMPELERDHQIDKLKGLLYGYYIGGLLSSSLDTVQRLNRGREIENVFSAILSNLNKQVTDKQMQQLEKLFNTKEQLHRYLDLLLSGEESPEQNPAIQQIKKDITEIETKRPNQAIKPEAKELTIINYRIPFISPDRLPDEKDQNLFMLWANKIFCTNQFNGNISIHKNNLSDELTESALRRICNKNEKDPIVIYLEQLRKHVRGYAFNVQWDNGLLSSVAAVLIAGEEWTKLLRFMQSKEMTDYTLAFAIFGCLNGFAALPRDFTDILYNQDPQYVAAVCSEFNFQLFGKPLDTQKLSSAITQSPKSETATDPQPAPAVKTASSPTIASEAEATNTHLSKEQVMTRLNNINITKATQQEAVWEAYTNHQSDEDFLKKIKNITGIGTKKAQNIATALGIDIKERQKPKQGLLFEKKDDATFIRSLKCIQKCSEEHIERLINNFRYTRKNAKPEKNESKKDAHIKFFISLCAKEGRGEISKQYALKGFFTPEIAEQFKKEIEEKYDQYFNN